MKRKIRTKKGETILELLVSLLILVLLIVGFADAIVVSNEANKSVREKKTSVDYGIFTQNDSVLVTAEPVTSFGTSSIVNSDVFVDVYSDGNYYEFR